MIICSCKGVSDRTIHRLVRAGNITVEALGALTGAGTDCGMCVNALHTEIDALLAKEPELLARVKVGLPASLTSPVTDRSY
ncbi:MAG: (2Fe-2S)-binding protein [Acidobacteria bacterium]|nr:(2Fe-2S)-binding protein [Acidobacteriota bacterium]